MFMKQFLCYLFILLSFQLSGQQVFEYANTFSVTAQGKTLTLPFTGGINAAQFQTLDMDGDGVEELVAWDINARRIVVSKITQEGFEPATELAYAFPDDVNGFLVLVDFDGDGRKDLFTSSPFGIRVYRNTTPSGSNRPQWTLAQNFLRLDNGSNLQANNLDIPLIMDLDGDGDLDIATFNFASGDFLELYINTSVERKGTPDVDGFAFPQFRWGGFEFCDCGEFSFGVTCNGLPIASVPESNNQARIQHAGGHSLLYADFDGDGVADLLLGRDECSRLYYLPNKGTTLNPVFDTFSTEMPIYGELPEFPVFHTAFLWKDELIVSSNSSEFAGAFRSDYRRNVFAIAPFTNSKSPFLQDEMIDLGENSRPFFKGFQSDGELIVTGNRVFDGGVRGHAQRWSVKDEEWTLLEDDYLQLSRLKLSDIQYQEFLTSAGRQTYWLSGYDTVNRVVTRRVWMGTSPILEQMQEVTFPETGIRPLDHLEVFSWEGKDYVLLARQTGELVLFEANLSNNPQLRLEERSFLGFNDSPAARNLTVHVVQGSRLDMYAVDQRGIIQFIPDFMNQSERQAIELRLPTGQQVSTRLGRNTWISSLGKTFGGGSDLVLGTTAGGLEWLRMIAGGGSAVEGLQVRVFPNPSEGLVTIVSSEAGEFTVYNSLGQLIRANASIPANSPLLVDLQHLAPGIYFVRVRASSGSWVTKKLIISHR